MLQGGVTWSYAASRAAESPADALMHARLATWFVLPYPLLVGLVIAEFAGHGRRSRAATAALAGVGVLVAAAAATFLVEPTRFVGPVTRSGAYFTTTSGDLSYFVSAAATAAGGAAVLAASRVASSRLRSTVERKQAALVGLAFGFLVSHSGAAFALLAVDRLANGLPDWRFLVPMTAAIASLAIVIASLRALTGAFDGAARRAAWAVAAVPIATGAIDGVLAPLALRGIVLLDGYDNAVLLRRAAFATALALALVRYGLAGFGERARHRTMRLSQVTLAAAVAAFAAGIVLAFLGVTNVGLTVAPVVAVAALALSPLPLRPTASYLARLVAFPQSDEAVTERVRVYSTALRHAVGRDGIVGADAEARLDALRADLGVAPAEHALLLAAVRAERAGDSPERLLGRYRVERELGRGAFGSALLAVDAATGRRVVLKRYHAKGAAERAEKEARALAAVRHPNVVELLCVERVRDEMFLVLALAEGGSARDALDRDGPMTPVGAARVVLEILDGLAALHARGIVHRDVKLENVLFAADGRALLADFGSASVAAARGVDATMTGDAVVGTLATAPPEALRGVPATPASDVYAAGAVLYRLLTGEHYVDLDAADAFTIRDRVMMDPPRLPHPRVPAPFADVIARALRKRAEERYADAATMRRALEAAVALPARA